MSSNVWQSPRTAQTGATRAHKLACRAHHRAHVLCGPALHIFQCAFVKGRERKEKNKNTYKSRTTSIQTPFSICARQPIFLARQRVKNNARNLRSRILFAWASRRRWTRGRKIIPFLFIHSRLTTPLPLPSSLSTSGAGPQLLAACTAVGAFLGYQVRTNTLLSLSFLFCAFINKYLCCDTHVFLFIFLFSPLPLHLPRVHQIHTYEEWAAANTADLVKLQAKKTAEKM